MKHIASPLARLVAHFIEMALNLLMMQGVLLYALQGSDLTHILDNLLIGFILWCTSGWIFNVVLNIYLTSALGGGIGKLLTGIRVVGADQKPISLWQAFLRQSVGYMVSGVFLNLGFIWILIDKQRRAWHDMMVDTYVVVRDSKGQALGLGALVVLVGANVWLGMGNWKQFTIRKALVSGAVVDVAREMVSFVNEPGQEATPSAVVHQSQAGKMNITLPSDWSVFDIAPDASRDVLKQFLVIGYPKIDVPNLESSKNQEAFYAGSYYSLIFRIQRRPGSLSGVNWNTFRDTILKDYQTSSTGFTVATDGAIVNTHVAGKDARTMNFTFTKKDTGDVFARSLVVIDSGVSFYLVQVTYPTKAYSNAEKERYGRDHVKEIDTMLSSISFF